MDQRPMKLYCRSYTDRAAVRISQSLVLWYIYIYIFFVGPLASIRSGDDKKVPFVSGITSAMLIRWHNCVCLKDYSDEMVYIRLKNMQAITLGQILVCLELQTQFLFIYLFLQAFISLSQLISWNSWILVDYSFGGYLCHFVRWYGESNSLISNSRNIFSVQLFPLGGVVYC